MKKKTIIKKKPLISVVMPVCNGEKYLIPAVESVLNQTYRNFELIITNDGSKDNTKKIVDDFCRKDKRVSAIHLKNQGGISNAMNLAIRKAKGNYIVRADGDDICDKTRFKKQVDKMLNNNRIDVLGTYFCIFTDNPRINCKTVLAFANDIRNGKPPVHHPTCMIKTEIFSRFGTYLSAYDNAEDVELWYRWFSQGVRFENIKEVLYKKRIHEGCVSLAKIRNQTYLLLKINLKAIFQYKIKFTWKGYKRVFEQAFYLIYLTLGLDKIYRKGS